MRFRMTLAGACLMAACAAAPASAEQDRSFPQGRATCHARTFDAAHLARHPRQRVVAISFERTARDLAAEKEFVAGGEVTENLISATLRVRFRGDGVTQVGTQAVTHVARLECDGIRNSERSCGVPACQGGAIMVAPDTAGAIRIGIGGGRLKTGAFIAHFIHLDDSCEGAPNGPLVLESSEDDRDFRLQSAPAEACR